MSLKTPTARAGDASRWAEFTERQELRLYSPPNYRAQRLDALRRLSRRHAESKWSRRVGDTRFVSELSDRQRADLADRIGWPAVTRRLVAIERRQQ